MSNKKPYHIHFICIGNAYRSRLAETYLRSKNLPGIITSSSGIHADFHKAGNGPICWYALRLARKFDIIEYISHSSTQTNLLHIMGPDHHIFMHQEVLHAHKNIYERVPKKFDVWDIEDMHIDDGRIYDEKEKEIIRQSEASFEKIRKNVDELVEKLRLLG